MKKIFIVIAILVSSIASVFALSKGFKIDSSKLSFSTESRKNTILDNFNNTYSLSATITDGDMNLQNEIEALTKKVTYLLLGDFNNPEENSKQYYDRYQEYLSLRYNPEVPKDSSYFSGLDEDSEEFKDDLLSGISLPGMFLKLDELDINYNSFGNIRVSKAKDSIISAISLPNITIREENNSNPKEYIKVKTNLILYYYFKQLNGQYKLYYLIGETTDELRDYFTEMEDNENKSKLQIAPAYDSNMREIYNYSKLDKISKSKLESIYNSNKNNIVILDSYYNNYIVSSANGFFINEGLIATTWNFIENSLAKSQFISIKDYLGKVYLVDGIVTANPDTNIVVLKLKEKNNNKVQLGNSKNIKVEDPAISISSKTGVGLTLQKGIVISNEGYIQSAIPLSISDEGSPLFDKEGNVIGMNTSKQVNTSVSIAINSEILKEIQDKFKKIDFKSIETISFEELKEKLYYLNFNKELVKNNIPSSKWKKYSKIGDIENTISLKLVKASYKEQIVSLRYQNEIADYMDSMTLASSFKQKLIEQGYIETLVGNKKCIYKNDKYQVTIMKEFDYLIVVMVKL